MEDSALEQQTSERFLEICGEDLAHGQVTRNWGGYICSESSWGKDLRMIGGVADEDWQALRGAIHKVAFLRAWQAGRATSWVRRTEDLSGYLGEEKYHAFEKMGTVTEREDYVNMNIPLIASRSRHLAKLRFHDLSDWEDLI